MDTVSLIIDDVEVKAREGSTVLEAAQEAGIYIPSLCSHPDLPPSQEVKPVEVVYRKDQDIQSTSTREYEGCRLCVVEIEGTSELPTACTTPVSEGMVVHTNTPAAQELRRRNLSIILGDHPHTCLNCAQREGCAREPCSMKIDYELRCCPLLGRCEFQKIADYIGIGLETPRYNFADLPVIQDEPLFKRNYNLCIGCTRCVRACKELRGVGALGFVWQDNKAIVGNIAPTLKESECRFCTACVEVCPTGALTDLETRWTGEALVRCKENCPVHIDIPRYIRHIAEENFPAALAVIREKVPFPMTLGYVCAHPCETECRRRDVSEPIAICSLKRFAAEQDGAVENKVAPATNKRVAIVGSGPAGLTAAYYLAKRGHSVTVFEALSEAGGMMRVGIPEYRVPRKVVETEIDNIRKMGVEIKLNTCIGNDLSVEDLSKDYDAIFLASGAHLTRPLNIDGVALEGVFQGVYLLRDRSLDQIPADLFKDKRVIVIGGGNVAIDAARTAARLGASAVELACLESRDEMPAHSWEIEFAIEEGTNLNCSWGPKAVIGKDGRVAGVEFIRCTSVFDENRKFNPSYDESEKMSMEGDAVIIAIGQASDTSFLGEESKIELTRGGTIKVDDTTMRAGNNVVFAGGDVTSGPASVIKAIAAGRKAAIAIDQHLGGEGDIEEVLVEAIEPGPNIGREEGFALKGRTAMPCLGMPKRIEGFADVELGFSKEMAIEEAKRCLQCDLRLQISPPPLPPETRAIQDFTTKNINAVPEKEGVIQLFNEEKSVIYIAGTTNLRDALQEFVDNDEVYYFFFEESDMYTSKQDELTQQYMQEHGAMPKLNDSMLDDLF
ncbi:FAD-dependent oxidoreductase [Chloroflexota bacterium]